MPDLSKWTTAASPAERFTPAIACIFEIYENCVRYPYAVAIAAMVFAVALCNYSHSAHNLPGVVLPGALAQDAR